jgi:hypothetical protein
MYSLYLNNSPSANKTINKTANSITCYFNPSIDLDPKKRWEMRLLQANIVYCSPNITSKNNVFSYTYDSIVYTHTFDTGLYSLVDINSQIARWTVQDTGITFFSFQANEATSTTLIYFSTANTSIDCTISNCIMGILGFPVSSGHLTCSVDSYIQSPSPIMLNSLQQFLISCSVINGVYQNSQLSNILCGVPINVAPYSINNFQPIHPTRCTVFVNRIDTLTITLLDQNGNNIDFTNEGYDSPENWNVCITIEPQDMVGIL